MITIVSAIASYHYFGRQQPITQNNSDFAAVLAAESNLDINQTPPEDLKTLTVLLLGYGGAGHQGGFLTDVIQLVHVNFETGQLALISVPRDLWVKLPNGTQGKINTAFTLGNNPDQPIESGGQIAKQMASVVTGLPVNYFIAVDFVGFQRLIGQELKGIEVEVTETLDDPWYPIKGEELNTCGMTPEEVAEVSAKYSGFELERQFACRYEHVHVEPGWVKMEGGDVLKYVRSRHGSGAGDFSRSHRQHEVLSAIKNKLLSLEALKKAPQMFEQVSRHTRSDIDLEVVNYIVPALQQIGSYNNKTVILSTDNMLVSGKSPTGQSIVVPKAGADNWSAIQQFIQTEIR